MKRSSRRRAGLAAVAGLSLVVAACSSNASSSGGSTSGAGSPAATSSAASSSAAASSVTGGPSSQAASSSGSSGAGSGTGSGAADSSAAGSSSGASGGVTLPNNGQPVTITFWHAYSSAAEVPMVEKTVIPAFEKLYPNVTVKDAAFSHDDLYQKLLTGAAAGQLPDVVRSDIAWTPTFAAQGMFGQLDGMPGFQALADATFPGILSTNAYQGHYYGLPLDTNTRVLLYNADTLKQAGISAPPKTFDDLKKDAPLLKAKGIYAFADGGTGGWNVLPWIWSAGGSLTNDSYTKATGYINGAASVSAVQMLVDLYKEGAIPDIMLGAQGGLGTSDGVPKGKYATILDGPWMFPIWQGSYPDFKPSQALVPAGPGGSVSVVGGEDINMVASTQHKDAAQDFIAFMLSPQAQLDMTKAGQLSVRKDLRDQVTSIQPYYATYLEQLATAKARTPVPNYPKIDTILGTEVANAMSGKKTAQQAMNDAAAQIDPLLPKS